MNTVELHDGRVLEIDLHRITILEWRSIFDRDQAPMAEDEVIAKVVGMKLKEYQALSQPDWRAVVKAVIDAGTGPLDDPNSQSASTED
jgi:hypothetical protein